MKNIINNEVLETEEDVFESKIKVSKYVEMMNKEINSFRKSHISLFEQFKKASIELSTREYNDFCKSINLDKTTVSKMRKVVENSVVMYNLNNLPVYYSTLEKVVTLDRCSTEHDEPDYVQTLISNKKITIKTTRIQIARIIEEYKSSKSTDTSNSDEDTPNTFTHNDVETDSYSITLERTSVKKLTKKQLTDVRKKISELEKLFQLTNIETKGGE